MKLEIKNKRLKIEISFTAIFEFGGMEGWG